MDAETEIKLKEQEEEIASLRSANASLKEKDFSVEQKKLQDDLALEKAERAKLQETLTQKEYAEKKTAILKEFSNVTEDLIPVGIPLDQLKEFAGKLHNKIEEAKPKGPKAEDFNKIPAGSPNFNPGNQTPKEESLKNAQEKRVKFLATLQGKDYNKDHSELMNEALGTKILY